MAVESASFTSDVERWDALLRRDRAADGVFWYSVRTTGVYCRPTCGVRLPLRGNVEFHDTREAAELAGFRPCKRCRPREETLDERRSAAVIRACREIEASEDRVLDLDTLAASAGMSRFHFQRLFKATTGVTPKRYADTLRGQRLSAGLADGVPVARAFGSVGLAPSGHSHHTATERLGMSPRTYLKGGQGETIRYAISKCTLGAVLVAASAKGVCAIHLGDDPEALIRELQGRFPQAKLAPGGPDFEKTVAIVLSLIDKPPGPHHPELPLDIRGTAFQQRVWQALRAIPPGSTATYTDIAARIGRPTAVRAVAAACAANPIALVVPCHRVVRRDESLGGYRWGIERKRSLLERERSGKTIKPSSVRSS